jgi:hypothetical protein
MRDKRTDSAAPTKRPAHEASSLAERSLRARVAAYAMHARHDARQVTAKARSASEARFERQVDPHGVLDPQERRRRAEQARNAHMARMSLAAIKARRAKRGRS